MKYPVYPAYKDSGVDWLGEIPAHWNIKRAKWLFDKMQRPVRDEDDIITAFRDGQVTLRKNRRTEGFTNALEEHGYQGIRKGDLVIHAMDAFAGAIGVSDSDGKSTPVYSVCTPSERFSVNTYYYAHLLRHMSRGGYIESLATGIRQRSTDFRFNTFSMLFLALPPIQEQNNILAFLDAETAQIDTLIVRQEWLIALLQEKRQALISHAVTKGLNPDAPMKDSGVEWIGEIPNSWKMIPFGYLLERIETGWTPTSEQRLAEDDEWAVLKVGCIRNGKFYQDEHKALAPSVEPDPSLEVHPGDLLMSRANTLELAGSVGLIETTRSRLTLSDKTFRLILKADLLSSYANQLLQSRVARNQIELSATGASQSMKNISQSSVRALLLPIPPLAEQSSIIDHLQLETQKIELLVAKAERAIGLLQERRTALISAAVTGKIDVRASMN